MNPTSLGRTVRWARKRAGMTQHELARALRMPQPSIARIERGAVIPRTVTLLAILEATGHRLIVEPADPAVDIEPIKQRLALEPARRTWRALGSATRNPMTSPIRILRRLRRLGVPFVLVGELAEVVHGSPATIGRVVEVCHDATQIATDRLATALEDLQATSSDGREYKTPAGRLRLMTETPAGDTYEVLSRNALPIIVASGIRVRVAALEDLIRIREAGGTDAGAASGWRARGAGRAAPARRPSGRLSAGCLSPWLYMIGLRPPPYIGHLLRISAPDPL